MVSRVPKFLHLLLAVFDRDDGGTIRKRTATTLQELSGNALRRITVRYCDNHTKHTNTMGFETYVS